MSVKLQMAWLFFYSWFCSTKNLATLVCVDVWQHHQGALLKKQHLEQIGSLYFQSHTLVLLRFKDSGRNITHLPTLPLQMGGEQGIINQEQANGQSMGCQSDRRLICHSRAAGFTQRVNFCKFTLKDSPRKRKEICWWVSPLTWNFSGLIKGYYTRRNLLE